ncbi:hypothetical protein LY622_05880 [Halomonas sp. M5N1S17]|uniref:hypothetical protein n=1 Tax=Halomonas alkalisoli TaxID=2907158 RepID=UPI001F378E6E|nr:hypothetical protein [Halomonas alkalisoli]MCE9662964.1 hypothetical protein [Halomonas alkalisoli]
MNMKSIVVTATIAASVMTTSAFAWTTATSDDEWRSGWGQGVAEAEVTRGSGNKIYVACESGSRRASSIHFSLAGDGPRSNEIIMIFDQGPLETISVDQNGTISSDSRAGALNFDHVLEKLKIHNSVYIRFSDGRESTFTLKGSAKAISEDCRAAFWD